MPVLDVSELNIIIAVLGAFIILYGFLSFKIKNVWYLGEALPAVMVGIILGPIAAKFIDAERWGSATPDQQNPITLGMCRIVIGVQLVIAGYQLPAKYLLKRWKEMLICLLPVMTIMWLCTSGCIAATIPNLSLLATLVIGSCVTCTDPILSQAIAKGPFADKYVARDLREIISAEAGANDGFGFPFLMLAVYLIRFANVPGAGEKALEAEAEVVEPGMSEAELVAPGAVPMPMATTSMFPTGTMTPVVPTGVLGTGFAPALVKKAVEILPRMTEEEVGRLGGGVGKAIGTWFLETWLYIVLMSVAWGVVCGYGSMLAIKYATRKGWIDSESFLLWPTALGLFIVGTCGAVGTDDLLACFFAGNALNWDGSYLQETEKRHDEVNSCVDVLLNFGGFMYIGSILPWDEFNQPEIGITYPRLFALGFMVMLFRRIPAILMTYKIMPKVCKNWKEALFMGYFGPIGIGAVFYTEHTRELFPELGEGDPEETALIRALPPVVYWLVLFSIVFHGLSIPALDLIYRWAGVKPIQNDDDVVEIRPLSIHVPAPVNSEYTNRRKSVMVYNRFSRAPAEGQLPINRFSRGPADMQLPQQWQDSSDSLEKPPLPPDQYSYGTKM